SRDPAAAETAFKKAIDAKFESPASVAFAWRGLGEIARGRNQIDRAIQCFEKSLSVSPNADAHRSLSALYATEKRDFEKAAHHAKAAVDLSPEDPIALVHCCVLYNGACYHAVRGNKADALAMLKEFFSTPNHRHITREEIVRDP